MKGSTETVLGKVMSEHNISNKMLADRIGISYVYMSLIRTGGVFPERKFDAITNIINQITGLRYTTKELKELNIND